MKPIVDNGTTVLLADEGMKLTNGSSFVNTVRLGKDDDGAMWHEITNEEAEKRMNEDEDEAVEADYLAALARLGVK